MLKLINQFFKRYGICLILAILILTICFSKSYLEQFTPTFEDNSIEYERNVKASHSKYALIDSFNPYPFLKNLKTTIKNLEDGVQAIFCHTNVQF